MTFLRTWWLLLRICFTTSKPWFVTSYTYDQQGVRWTDGLIRYIAETGQLRCPLQALGMDILTSGAELNIIRAADNSEAPWRWPLLWATKLSKTRKEYLNV